MLDSRQGPKRDTMGMINGGCSEKREPGRGAEDGTVQSESLKDSGSGKDDACTCVKLTKYRGGIMAFVSVQSDTYAFE